MSEARLLSVRDVAVRYGTYIAVQNVSLEVAEGEVVCLMGHNGSGKSSLMNAVSGLVRPAAGEVWFDGARIDTVPTHRLLERGLAHVLERRRLFPFMSVEENLLLGAYLPKLRRARAEALDAAYEMFPVLRERRRQLASTLSGGQQQMVSIARALMGRPRFLMLDEPFLGLSPRLVGEISGIIRKINEQGVTVLFTEQAIQQSLKLSDRGYILESGRLAIAGTSAELLADEQLHRIYMGLEHMPRARKDGDALARTPSAPRGPMALGGSREFRR
jgi:branched-chain amino acid transport system ATP-binding protein